MGKERSRRSGLGGAVVGGTPGLTGSRCDQWRGAGGGRGREAQGTLVNGPLCTRGLNGGLCEGRRGGGGELQLEAGMPGSLGSRREGETRKRIYFCRTPTAYQALSQALTHGGRGGDAASNNKHLLSTRSMPGAVLSASPA